MRDTNRDKIHMRKTQDVHTHRLHNIQHIATKYPNRTKTKQKMYQKKKQMAMAKTTFTSANKYHGFQ